ncbi:MAG: hypothetical protein LAO55_08505 [Acidobacteriia bacterium]|nr:hypothetical protein [Terriglobia bacterium]
MNRQHLSDDELIGMLYGLGNMKDDAGHLADCSECSERLRAMGQARAATVDAPQISGRMLATQRQQILERLGQPSSGSWRWIPAAAAAALLAGALFLSRPVHVSAPSARPAVNTESDAELFTDVYSMERDVEPRAAAPIRSLFQEASFEKEGQ